jgi:6-phosphogluconolactonase
VTPPEIIVAPDAAAVAADGADRFVAAAAEAIAARGRFAVAVAGGHTPEAMNALLAAEPYRSRVAWDRVRFFFGDERTVPPEHPDSNYGMTRRTLFAPLGIAEEHVYRMRGEDEPHAAARAYEQVLVGELGQEPKLDLILLGMGPDGHTASLFPGTLAAIPETALAWATYVEKFTTYRLTLTPRTINAARAVVVQTAGAEKRTALALALAPDGDVAQTPIRIVRPTDGTLTYVVDRAARG